MKKALLLSLLALATAGMATVLAPSCAMAAGGENLTQIASGFSDVAKSFGPMLRLVFIMGGFFLVGVGLWQLYQKSQQPGQPKGGAIIAIFIGALLIAAPQLAKMIGGTLGTGSDGASDVIK